MPFTDPHDAVEFILGGNATVTLQGKSSRFTYRVRVNRDVIEGQPKPEGPHFVSVLTGSDNETDYTFLGTIFEGRNYHHGRKSRIGQDAPSARAWAWSWPKLANGVMPEGLSVYHEGRCGRCNRLLTDPTSIETGFGPVCREAM